MNETCQFHRKALLDLVRGPWSEFWLVTPCIELDAVNLLLPYLQREGAQVRVITYLSVDRLAGGQVDLMALQALRGLPNCEIRHLADLAASVYAAGPDGTALVTGAPLTMAGLDGPYRLGALLPAADTIETGLAGWWATASPVTDANLAELAVATSHRLEAHSLREEIARVGAFVRVSVRGTRRTRRLFPREFGVAEGEWGRVVRPVEVALYKLDDVIRARDELEAVLAENGLEWNGYYLVPRRFLEAEWPRLFAARERQLREQLQSAEGKAAVERQLARARRELEAFLTELYPRADSQGLPAEEWVPMQTTRILTETVQESILAESTLEYRVLTILPEDERSVEELQKLLQDPRLRSVQLTFHF